MDITTVPIKEVVSVYNRQEKLAESRKKAEARMIKTAVAERITLSSDARKFLSSQLPESADKAEPGTHSLPGNHHTYPAAREYQRNQPIMEQPVEEASGIEKLAPLSRPGTAPGKPESVSASGSAPQAFVLEIPKHIPQYSFPIPKELKAYISTLPRKEKVRPPRNEEEVQKAA